MLCCTIAKNCSVHPTLAYNLDEAKISPELLYFSDGGMHKYSLLAITIAINDHYKFDSSYDPDGSYIPYIIVSFAKGITCTTSKHVAYTSFQTYIVCLCILCV